jgi:REP element-mobilizing transposase RayT
MSEIANFDLGFFNPWDDLEINHGDLPHWRQGQVAYFVTFRLGDSLPQSKLKQLKADKANWIKMAMHKRRDEITKQNWQTYNYLFHERIEKWLEAGYGSWVLLNKEILYIMLNALNHFENERYILDSFVIMPNHINLIVQPINGFSLSHITHSWKSFSANAINGILGQKDQLWQRESYDHIIRSQEALQRIRTYIQMNPTKAGITVPTQALRVNNVQEASQLSNVQKASQLPDNKNHISPASNHTSMVSNHTSQISISNITRVHKARSFGDILHKAGSFGNILTLLFIALASLLQAQSEKQFIQHLNSTHFHGLTEVTIYGGRADIVNEEYAIEVEWAEKWKNSIGQALWYGLQTNKKPGIVVILKDINDRKYAIMLQSAIDYAGLKDKIKVWFYPEDFGGSFTQLEEVKNSFNQNVIQGSGNYTRNKNSGVRHKSTCAYADCKNCVPCGPSDGKKACGKCGG